MEALGGLDGNERITQFVTKKREPQDRPRPEDRDGLSLIRGEVSVPQAARYVRLSKAVLDGDGVRFTTAQKLVDKGFLIERTPTRRNPNHISVTYEGEWNDTTADLFNSCFDPSHWYTTEKGGESG